MSLFYVDDYFSGRTDSAKRHGHKKLISRMDNKWLLWLPSPNAPHCSVELEREMERGGGMFTNGFQWHEIYSKQSFLVEGGEQLDRPKSQTTMELCHASVA